MKSIYAELFGEENPPATFVQMAKRDMLYMLRHKYGEKLKAQDVHDLALAASLPAEQQQAEIDRVLAGLVQRETEVVKVERWVL